MTSVPGNRYICECIEGYYPGGPNGVCIKDCSVYGDSKLDTCANDPTSCCCESGYTYTDIPEDGEDA